MQVNSKSCSSNLIDWGNYSATLSSLRSHYYDEDFIAVDRAIDCLVNSGETFSSGKQGAAAVYWFYRKEMPSPGSNEEDILRINKWNDAIKNSPYASFASLRLMYSQAWNERGNRYVIKTPQEKLKNFRKKLLLTESAILSRENPLKESAISYNLLLAVTLDTYGTKSLPIDIFNKGVESWPNYYDFYDVFLSRLTPKWGGSWQKVEDFISHWDIKLEERENRSLYSRLYYTVHKSNRVNPLKTKADWKRLKSSLTALYTQYPTKKHIEIATSYACYYSDYEFYNSLLSQKNVSFSKAWLRGTSIEKCNAYFSSQLS